MGVLGLELLAQFVEVWFLYNVLSYLLLKVKNIVYTKIKIVTFGKTQPTRLTTHEDTTSRVGSSL